MCVRWTRERKQMSTKWLDKDSQILPMAGQEPMMIFFLGLWPNEKPRYRHTTGTQQVRLQATAIQWVHNEARQMDLFPGAHKLFTLYCCLLNVQ